MTVSIIKAISSNSSLDVIFNLNFSITYDKKGESLIYLIGSTPISYTSNIKVDVKLSIPSILSIKFSNNLAA